MNKERRLKLNSLLQKLEQNMAELQDINEQLKEIAEAEREAYDNMPEGLQQSDKGYQAEAAADALDEALSQLEDSVMYGMQECIDNITVATE